MREKNRESGDTLPITSTIPGLDTEILHELRALVEGTPSMEFSANTVVYSEGEPATGMYYLNEGEVVVTRRDGELNIVLVLTILPRYIFGINDVLNNRKYTSTAIARKQSTLSYIPREHLDAALRHKPALALPLMKILCRRLDSLERNTPDQTGFLPSEKAADDQ